MVIKFEFAPPAFRRKSRLVSSEANQLLENFPCLR